MMTIGVSCSLTIKSQRGSLQTKIRRPTAVVWLVDATLRKRAAPECRYVVVDADGRIALLGVLFPPEEI